MMNIYSLYIAKYLHDVIMIQFAQLMKDVRMVCMFNDILIIQVCIGRVSRISDGSEDLNNHFHYWFTVPYQYLGYPHFDDL